MIAIGGVVGTGLFLGTGSDLENGGPAGLLLGYCIMASLLYSVMVSVMLLPAIQVADNPFRLLWVKCPPSSPLPVASLLLPVDLIHQSLVLRWVYYFGSSKPISLVLIPPADQSLAILVRVNTLLSSNAKLSFHSRSPSGDICSCCSH